MFHNCRYPLSVLLLLLVLRPAIATPVQEKAPPVTRDTPIAPYLRVGAPTFDLTAVTFREKYNAEHPDLPIAEFRALDSKQHEASLTLAVSSINEYLYASTALEKGTGKIKTLQLTYRPSLNGEEKTGYHQAVAYMAALMRTFDPVLTREESLAKINSLLTKGRGSAFFEEQVGALRYVVSDSGEQGITFAIEPIKLTLSEP